MNKIIIKEKIPTIKEIQELRTSIEWNPRSEEAWEKIIKKSIFFSAWDGELLVGVARMIEDGTMCVFYDHCVRREYQRQGIGTQLNLARVKKAKELGCTYIQGFASEQGANLFKKMGFNIITGVELRN